MRRLTKAIDARLMFKDLPGSSLLAHVLSTEMGFNLHQCVVLRVGIALVTKAIAARRIFKDFPGPSLLAHVLRTKMGFYLHLCVVLASKDSPGDQGRRCSPNMQRLPRAITTRPRAKYRNGLLPTSLRCVCE